MFWHRYLSKDLWDLMFDQTKTWDTVLDAICRRNEQMGLLWPNEHTALLIWCTFVLCRATPSNAHAFDPNLAYERKGQVMKAMAMHRSRTRTAATRSDCLRYPAFPHELRQQFPDVYASAFNDNTPEIACQVDENLLFQLKARLPCRRTHTTLQAPPSRSRQNFAHSGALRFARATSNMWDANDPIPDLQIMGGGRMQAPNPACDVLLGAASARRALPAIQGEQSAAGASAPTVSEGTTSSFDCCED